jgi:hypothetical protein
MRLVALILGAVAVAAVAVAVVLGVRLRSSDDTAAPCGDRLYGHIATMTSSGDHYVMRFDPSLLTSGETANVAAAEDGAVDPGQPVPNDNYEVDEGNRLFTYLVPSDTPVRVLTNNPDGTMTTDVSVSTLAALVRGETPIELFEPLDTGVFLRVHVDTVCDIEQAYKP